MRMRMMAMVWNGRIKVPKPVQRREGRGAGICGFHGAPSRSVCLSLNVFPGESLLIPENLAEDFLVLSLKDHSPVHDAGHDVVEGSSGSKEAGGAHEDDGNGLDRTDKSAEAGAEERRQIRRNLRLSWCAINICLSVP